MGKPLSGYDHWEAIIRRGPASAPPVRKELVVGRNSYYLDIDLSLTLRDTPRGAYIYDGWKIVVGDK